MTQPKSDLAYLRSEKAKAEQQLRYYKHREKILEHQIPELTRKARVHRLCTRAGMLESFLIAPEELTNDQVIFEKQIGIKLNIIGCIGALALILTGVISEKDALKSIDLKTIFLFGGTLSLASALDKTGAGAEIANIVIGALGENPSPYVLTLVVFLLCCVMTNFMSNTATTALMVPICLSIAQGMGADPRAVLMACVIGGSCAYATPIGMPANTMVVSAGGYTFKDYAKAGLPLILIATVVSMVILPIAFPFFPQ